MLSKMLSLVYSVYHCKAESQMPQCQISGFTHQNTFTAASTNSFFFSN